MIDLSLEELRAAAGIGVAGNFTGHLEQAGESADFTQVNGGASNAPKGIFPFYLPGASSFLGEFPISHHRLALPTGEATNLQIEPEAGLVCELQYDSAGRVTAVVPIALGAFNDCSIRREGARKISQKKNWGADSKGIARRCFAISDLGPGGDTAALRLTCFLRRRDDVFKYGIDSALIDYSYYSDQLLEWIAERINNQTGEAGTPLEPVGEYLNQAGRPRTAVIGIGATRYTDFGATNYLRLADESLVIVYDSDRYIEDELIELVEQRRETELARASVLCQVVHAA